MDPSTMQAKLCFVRLDALAQHIGRKVLSLYQINVHQGKEVFKRGHASNAISTAQRPWIASCRDFSGGLLAQLIHQSEGSVDHKSLWGLITEQSSHIHC